MGKFVLIEGVAVNLDLVAYVKRKTAMTPGEVSQTEVGFAGGIGQLGGGTSPAGRVPEPPGRLYLPAAAYDVLLRELDARPPGPPPAGQ